MFLVKDIIPRDICMTGLVYRLSFIDRTTKIHHCSPDEDPQYAVETSRSTTQSLVFLCQENQPLDNLLCIVLDNIEVNFFYS